MIELNAVDLQLILESLKYTKLKFEEYQGYPSYEYKQQRISEVNDVIAKIQTLKKSAK
jgi:tRNA A-37 threonylcarbamoyl transferase component Bud32